MEKKHEKNILVTGSGFYRLQFCKTNVEKHDYQIINLDVLTYAGNLENLQEVEKYSKYTFVKGDVTDAKLLDELFSEYSSIDGVVNFAAESRVDRSIENPQIFCLPIFLEHRLCLTRQKNIGKSNRKTSIQENINKV